VSEGPNSAGRRVGGGERAGGVRPDPRFERVLLRAYPRWFTAEYGDQVALHLRQQRGEARYETRVLGALRFWWEAGTDALVTGMALRLGRLRDGVARRRRAGDGASGSGDGGDGNGRGMLVAVLDAVARDARDALRGLRRNPGYTAVFVVTLGLGIGVNSAIFSAVNGVLVRPLPHEDGDHLVYFRQSAERAGIANVLFSVPEIDDYRQSVPSIEAVAEFSALTFTMLGYDTPRRVRAGIVTGNYFAVMGLGASLGRTVGPDDDGEGAPAVIVLSDAYWRSVFGGDRGVLGMTVRMNGRAATIVGVAERAPPYPEQTDIWVNLSASPHHLEATMKTDRVHRMTEVFARLSPGATVESARAESAAITARLHEEYPEAYDAASGFDVTVTPLKTQLTRRARPTLLLLLGTAFFVLIIACANLANLTLTRVLRRDHELAIRVSLGGSRVALRRAVLIESLILAVGGAALGQLMASASLDMLVTFAGRFTSRASEITLDGSVFGYAMAIAVAASLFVTMLPALPDNDRAGEALSRSGTRSTVGSGARRAQRTLVVAQIATSFVLLIGAGLLLRTMMHLNRVDAGFDTASILTLDIPPATLLATEDAVRNRYLAVLADVRALPGVESAALTGSVPLSASGMDSFRTPLEVEGHTPAPGAPAANALFRVVSPDYFTTLGIDVLEGREFTSTDIEDAQKVVVINESMARAYFGDREAVGRSITYTDELLIYYLGTGSEPRTVVGVVEDTRDSGVDADIVHMVYNPYPQVRLANSLVLRVNGDPSAVLPAVRETILGHDPNQPIANVATMAELGSESVAPRRLNATLLGAFAMLALIIAAIGFGGVLAFSVGSRTREFGVRSALGATRQRIGSGVLTEGAIMAAAGVAFGCLAAALLTRFISGMLIGVPPLDPVTFVGVGFLLAGVAMVAAWLPAWRAATVSPMEALAAE
jgi:predicted permease